MDVLETVRSAPVKLEAQVLATDMCPHCSGERIMLVWCGWTTRISRCNDCGHEWISHRMEFSSDNRPMID